MKQKPLQKRKKKVVRLKRMPRWFYKKVFDELMTIFMFDSKVPKKLLEKVDEVADYLGDVAASRK